MTMNGSLPKTYVVRFEDGPHDAALASVLGLESGAPPDLLLIPDCRDGVYVLAGGARPDGSLPYLWMTVSRVAALRHHGAALTTDATAR